MSLLNNLLGLFGFGRGCDCGVVVVIVVIDKGIWSGKYIHIYFLNLELNSHFCIEGVMDFKISKFLILIINQRVFLIKSHKVIDL